MKRLWLAVAPVGVAAALIGVGIGYWLGQGREHAPPAAAPGVAEEPAGEAASRPLLGNVMAAHEGAKPASSPHPSHFSNMQRFNVGARNVKAMVSDGPLVWVGTSEGMVRYDTRNGQHEIFDTSNSGLLSHSVFSLDKIDEKVWVGTYGGGLSTFDGESWSNHNIPAGLADPFVYGVAKAPNGDLWIATWSGANQVLGGKLDDRAAWRTHTVDNTEGGLPNDWVYSVEIGDDGSVWLATEGGLARYDGTKWKNWDHEAGLGAPYEKVKDHLLKTVSDSQQSKHHDWRKDKRGSEEVSVAYNANYIVAMLLDSKGRVLCGTWGGGLSVLENGEFRKTYTVAEGLAGNYVSMLAEAPDGTIWVGTSQGLSKVADGSFDNGFVNYGERDGLFSSYVFSMIFGEDGALWVGGFGGIVRYPTGLS